MLAWGDAVSDYREAVDFTFMGLWLAIGFAGVSLIAWLVIYTTLGWMHSSRARDLSRDLAVSVSSGPVNNIPGMSYLTTLGGTAVER